MKKLLLWWFTIAASVMLWFVLTSTPVHADNCGGYTDCANTADASVIIGVAVGVAVTGSMIALPALLHLTPDPTAPSGAAPALTIGSTVAIGEIGGISVAVDVQPTTTVEISQQVGEINPATAPFMEVLQEAAVHFLEVPNQPSPPHSIPGLGNVIDILVDRMSRMPNSGSYAPWIERHWGGAEFALRWILTHQDRVTAVELDKLNTKSVRTSGPDVLLSDRSLVELKSLKQASVMRMSSNKKFINSLVTTRGTYPTQPIQVVFDSRKAQLSNEEWIRLRDKVVQSLQNAGLTKDEIGEITFKQWP